MQMHEKKRLEIFIEAPALRRLTALLDGIDMSGYTIIPVLGGSGEHGAWTRDGLVSSAGGMVSVVCILVDAVVERVYTLVSRQIGVVNVTDCTVIRNAKF